MTTPPTPPEPAIENRVAVEIRAKMAKRLTGYLPVSPYGEPLRSWAMEIERLQARVVELENRVRYFEAVKLLD